MKAFQANLFYARVCPFYEFMNKEIEFRVRQALFDDDGVANSLESLAGTLKAAKRQDMEQNAR